MRSDIEQGTSTTPAHPGASSRIGSPGLLRRALLLFVAFDGACLLYFASSGARMPALLSLVALFAYVVAYRRAGRQSLQQALLLACFTAWVQASTATMLLGWDSDFHYLLLLLVPVLALSPWRACRGGGIVALLAYYIALAFSAAHVAPLAPLTPGQMPLVTWLNLGLFFAVVSLLGSSLRRGADAARQRVELLSTREPLTGLLNRPHFEALLQQRVAGSDAGDKLGMIVIGRIDGFGQINRTLGHAGGDAVLTALSTLFTGKLREGDLLGRWSGAQFIWLLQYADRAGAREAIGRIAQALEKNGVSVRGMMVPCRLSFGLAPLGYGDSVHAVTAQAQAMLDQQRSRSADRVVP